VQIIQPPRVEQRPAQTYLGIRVVTPFRGMLRVRDELLAELHKWLTSHDIEPTGPFFLRLHVIDMEGPMDLEVGVITTTDLEADDRVRPGVLPAGCRYEAYITDPRTEPRKTKWEVELNMRCVTAAPSSLAVTPLPRPRTRITRVLLGGFQDWLASGKADPRQRALAARVLR
jgi:hypothetical protein